MLLFLMSAGQIFDIPNQSRLFMLITRQNKIKFNNKQEILHRNIISKVNHTDDTNVA